MVAYWLPTHVDTMSSSMLPSAAPPGATSPHLADPSWLEYDATWPAGVVAPTTTMSRLP